MADGSPDAECAWPQVVEGSVPEKKNVWHTSWGVSCDMGCDQSDIQQIGSVCQTMEWCKRNTVTLIDVGKDTHQGRRMGSKAESRVTLDGSRLCAGPGARLN